MAAKRRSSLQLVPNPFIKKRNLEWAIEDPTPQETADYGDDSESSTETGREDAPPTASEVEAGRAQVEDHLEYFSQLLARATLRPYPLGHPHLAVDRYRQLYEENFGSPHGAHFIIHQHDHPIAGTHYDLRLQINETSSASWAIMYGLPGDPNSKRLNRNATETRVHCLWNHLIETASASTGSLLIWDTGTYKVLPRRSKHAPAPDPDSQVSAASLSSRSTEPSEQEKLAQAFRNRKILLQLRGTRLPRDYVLNLRLTKGEDAAGRARGARQAAGSRPRRRRRGPVRGTKKAPTKRPDPEMTTASSSSFSSSESESDAEGGAGGRKGADDDVVRAPAEADEQGISAMERELRELEDDEIRRTNAYTGAANTIGSVHQRRWYLSVDRAASGLVRRHRGRQHGARPLWGAKGEGDDDGAEAEGDTRLRFPFHVRGRDSERSVVTGRLGADILRDEGVEGFVERQGWRPVLN